MTQNEHPHFDAHQFWSVVGSTMRNVAAVLIAFGVLWAGLWTYVIRPQADIYFEAKLSDLKTGMTTINKRLDQIQAALPDPRPFVEIRGAGKIAGTEEVQAGSYMTVLYLVRRNSDCPTTIQVQFWSASANGVASEYSYTTPAQQATPSFGFQLASVRVRIPNDITSGWYSYVPTMVPDRTYCPGEINVAVEPSDFFRVTQ